MRNICFMLLLTLLLAACTKETEESYLSYSLNGKQTQYNGSFETYQSSGKGVYVNRTAGGASGRRYYLIEAMRDVSDDHIQIAILTDSLAVGTYSSGDTLHYANGIQMKTDPNTGYVFSVNYHARKPLVVQLTKHSGGRISGTFSGRVYNISNFSSGTVKDSADITGTINNVGVRY